MKTLIIIKLESITSKFSDLFGTLVAGYHDAQLTDGILVEVLLNKTLQQLNNRVHTQTHTSIT